MLDQFQNTDFSEIAKSMYGEDGTLNDIMKKQFSNLNMTQMLMDMPYRVTIHTFVGIILCDFCCFNFYVLKFLSTWNFFKLHVRWLQESNRAEVRCDKMPLCPEGKVAVQNSKKFDVPVLDLDAIVIKLTDELMEHEGVSDEIVPDYVHNLLLDMNPGWQQCLDQAEIDLRVVNGDFTKWDSTVHTIMSEYSSCNLAVCEDFCGPNTGNEHLLKGCKAGVNILMEDLHTNHHSTVHAEHEDIINPNAEFSCANFRFWQMKHSECVTYDKVKDTFYNSLTSFAANAGFAGKSAQLQEVTRIAHQVCAAQNMSFVDMETSADLRAKIVHGFFAEHHQHDQDLHMDRVDHLAIVGDKWEHFKDTIHSFLFPESAMDKTLKDISNGGLDEHLKSLMGDDSNLGDMMQNIGNLFGGGGNYKI